MYMLSTEDRLTLMLTAVYTYLMYIMYTWDLLKTLWGVTTNDQNLLAAVDNTLEVLYPELCILMQKCCFVLPLIVFMKRCGIRQVSDRYQQTEGIVRKCNQLCFMDVKLDCLPTPRQETEKIPSKLHEKVSQDQVARQEYNIHIHHTVVSVL